MKNKIARKIIIFAVLFASAFSFTSCNRGVGCPSNFSIQESATDILSILLGVF